VGWGSRRDADRHGGGIADGGCESGVGVRRLTLPLRSKGLRPEVERVGRGARGRDVDDE